MSDETSRPRNLLILTRAAATVGAMLRQRQASGAALLRMLLGDEPRRDDRTDDEAY